jgi:hypothetical protein
MDFTLTLSAAGRRCATNVREELAACCSSSADHCAAGFVGANPKGATCAALQYLQQ